MKPMYKFIATVMVYSLASFVIFTLVYGMMGMEKHFDVATAKTNNWGHAVYHAWNVQTTSMDEMSPKTVPGRIAQSCQAAAAWLPMILLLAPWDISST